MKRTTLGILLCILCIQLTTSQKIFYKNQETIYQYDLKTEKHSSSKSYNLKDSASVTDRIALSASDIEDQSILDQNYDFYQGLRSPFDQNFWVFMEREQIGGGYLLSTYTKNKKKKNKLFFKPNKAHDQLVFKPIAWTERENAIFVEGLYLDQAKQHEGIWILNIETGTLTNINFPKDYVNTPHLSPDRTTFVYNSTTDQKIDYLHGAMDVVKSYNYQTRNSNTIAKNKGVYLEILGWDSPSQHHKTLNKNNIKFSSLDYYLPWDAGVNLCVSRHGTPGPLGSHFNQGRCNRFGPGGHHGYAAVDFATSLSSDQNVRASASGTVSFAGISGSLSSGYGRLVIIRHSDGTRTYYAHNKSILVSTGQSVSRGQIIAKEGTTGGSTGDHIHFEWRAAGGNASTKGSFKGIGEPRQDYIYKSNNSTSAPPILDTTAPTTSISATGGNSQSGDFTANFTDKDNIGVTRRFYQALEKYGDNWYANRGNGFFNDNFNVFYSGYTTGSGSWAINNKHLSQSNTSSDNTSLSAFLSQNSGLPYLYEFAAKVNSTSGPRKFGIHIMASDATLSQRGNSYLIWFSGEDNKVRIYETLNDVLNFRAIADAPQDNQWANYKITYSPGFGVLEVFKNNTSLLKWTDSSPIKQGSSISLRTNATSVLFDDLKVYKFRANSSLTIKAGTEVTDDIRRRNGKIKSLVRDGAGNWSAPGNLDVTINSLNKEQEAPSELDQNDTLDFVLTPNPIEGSNFSIEFNRNIYTPIEISIIDLSGRTIVKEDFNLEKNIINKIDLTNLVNGLSTGQYFAKVKIEQEQFIKSILKR